MNKPDTTYNTILLFQRMCEAIEANQPQKARHLKKLLLEAGWEVKAAQPFKRHAENHK